MEPADDPVRELRQLVQLVEKEYLREIPRHDLVAAARTAILAALDSYSSYLTPDEHAAFDRATAGSFAGIGVRSGARMR